MKKERVAKNTAMNLLAHALMSVSGFILTPFMARGLGPDGYGLFVALGILSVNGYALLLEMGFQNAVTKFTAQYLALGQTEKANRLVNTVLFLFLSVGVVSALIGLFARGVVARLFHVPDSLAPAFDQSLIVIFATYLFAFPNLAITGYLQGLHRFEVLRKIELLFYALRILILIGLMVIKRGLFEAILATSILQFLQFVFSMAAAFKFGTDIRIGPHLFSWSVFKEIRHMTTTTFISRISGLAFKQADTLIITAFLGPASLAAYDVATKVPFVLKSALGRLNEVLVPTASALHQSAEDRTKLSKLYDKSMRLQYCLSAPIVVGLFIFAEAFLRAWVGEKYHSSNVLRLALLIPFLGSALGIGVSLLNGMASRLTSVTTIVVATSALNLALTVGLIPRFGIGGGVFGTVVATALCLAFCFKYFISDIGVSLTRSIKEVCLPYLISMLIWLPLYLAWPTPQSLTVIFVLFGTAGIISAIASYLFVFENEDRALIKSLLRRQRTA